MSVAVGDDPAARAPSRPRDDDATPPRAGVPGGVGRAVGLAIKRVFDVGASAAVLAVGAPAFAALAAVIKLDSPGPALYLQDRLGRDGRVYRIFKFRTMTQGAPIVFNPDGSTRAGSGDQRITRVGRLLRGGLDELPQIVNVLRGEMSVVGPRPDMASQRAHYAPGEERKLAMRPGITSLAAVLGRNALPWKTRIAIDCRYVERWSLGLDARIVVATLCLPLGIRPFRFDDVVGDILSERPA